MPGQGYFSIYGSFTFFLTKAVLYTVCPASSELLLHFFCVWYHMERMTFRESFWDFNFWWLTGSDAISALMFATEKKNLCEIYTHSSLLQFHVVVRKNTTNFFQKKIRRSVIINTFWTFTRLQKSTQKKNSWLSGQLHDMDMGSYPHSVTQLRHEMVSDRDWFSKKEYLYKGYQEFY